MTYIIHDTTTFVTTWNTIVKNVGRSVGPALCTLDFYCLALISNPIILDYSSLLMGLEPGLL